LRPAAFFCADVPPWLEEERDELEPDFLPPRLDAPGEFAIRAARCFDMPFFFSASYCFSFLTDARLPGMRPVFPCSERPNSRYALSMEPHEDSWESAGWPHDDLTREEVLQLARRLAAQRERQRSEDLVQIEELKRALRERAADVARRELEVEQRTRELEEQGLPRRTLRFRRAEKPVVDEDRAYTEELLVRREAEVDERSRAVENRERELQEREAQLLARRLELEESEPALAERERRVAELEERLRALDAKEQDLGSKEQDVGAKEHSYAERAAALEVDEQELTAARETLAKLQQELDERALALKQRDEELNKLAQRTAATEEQSTEHERDVSERESQLAAREQELRDRETEVLRLQAGLAAQQEGIRRRERSVEDAERALARETVAPATAHVSFSEGLEALTGWRPRRG
jgi:DNA repair exonuclease SbcCD ATPase subunit